MKLESPNRARSSSTREEEVKGQSYQPPRSKSATPLDNSGNNKRRSLPRHSYQKPTESSNAKTSNGAPTSPAKRVAGRRSGKLNSALKNKFKSTPDLASALKTEEIKPMPTSKTTEDISDISEHKSLMAKTVRRSMPATREHKDPFGLSLLPLESESSPKASTNTVPWKSDRKVSIGESHVIIESSQTHRKLPIPGGPPNSAMLPSALSRSQTNSQKPITKDEEDRLAMPPPSLPVTHPPPLSSAGQEAFLKKATSAKRSSIPDLTLAQAKAILLGKSNNKDTTSSESEKTDTSNKLVRTTKIEPRHKPTPVHIAEPETCPKPEHSLDVPAEGSPDQEMGSPPGGSIFKHWDTRDAMPMDLPVKDQSPSKQSSRSGFTTSTPLWRRSSGSLMIGRVSPFLGEQRGIGGEFDEAGVDLAQDDIADDGNVSGENSPLHGSPPFRRRERSLSPHYEGSPVSTPPGLSSPTRGRSHITARHIHRDESPLKFPKEFKVAFTTEARMVETMGSEEGSSPSPPKSKQAALPKSASMPDVKSEKALEEMCQTVTAKLDALVNKPLPSRTLEPKKKKSSPVSTLERLRDGPRQEEPLSLPASSTPEGEGDSAEIQRPDKTRTMPPTSLTTSLPASPGYVCSIYFITRNSCLKEILCEDNNNLVDFKIMFVCFCKELDV